MRVTHPEMDVARRSEIDRTARAYTRAEARLEEARRDRDEAIRAAVADGVSKAEAARLAGLSRERVQQIVEHRR